MVTVSLAVSKREKKSGDNTESIKCRQDTAQLENQTQVGGTVCQRAPVHCETIVEESCSLLYLNFLL